MIPANRPIDVVDGMQPALEAMSKADESPTDRPRIPSMEKILSSEPVARVSEVWGRDNVKEALRVILDGIRRADGTTDVSMESLAREADVRISSALRPTLRRVINGAGVIIHTNLGRSPVDTAAWGRGGAIVARYSNLEFDLASGTRGKRHLHVDHLAAQLFGCEGALLVNNNAAAVLLVLAAHARGREVVVSRGELVEIGGSFRVPDVIEQGGAKLREVGTTNRTRASDYEAATGRKTGALLQVHQSNFQIVGFTEAPRTEDLARVAAKRKVPLVVDEGSGRVIDLSRYGFRSEPTIRELFEAGADIVTCSTDKLIGSVQGGLILGSRKHLELCARHPLMRAFRPGKESFTMLGEALLSFLRGAHEREIPIYRMLSTDVGALRARAEALARGQGLQVVATRCALGGGTTPQESIPSVGLHVEGSASGLHETFRSLSTPVVGRVVDDRFVIDLRTVLPEEDDELAAMIEEARS
jgi:L-seryl-tRNA(Ser) seleniumtransferase